MSGDKYDPQPAAGIGLSDEPQRRGIGGMCFALVGEIRAIVIHETLLDLRPCDVVLRLELLPNPGRDDQAHGRALRGRRLRAAGWSVYTPASRPQDSSRCRMQVLSMRSRDMSIRWTTTDRRGRAGLTWQVAAALHPGSWNASSGTALPCRPSGSSRPDRSDHRYVRNAMCPNARGRRVFNDGAALPVATVRSPIDARGPRARSLPIRLTAPASDTPAAPARSPPGQRRGRAGTALLHASQRSLTRSRALVSRIAEWL